MAQWLKQRLQEVAEAPQWAKTTILVQVLALIALLCVYFIRG